MKSPTLKIGSHTFEWGSRTYVMIADNQRRTKLKPQLDTTTLTRISE